MRYLLAFTVALAGQTLLAAPAVNIASLPPWSLADTEVSTNAPFATGPDILREFRFSLDLDATPSNAVTVAFGRDVNTNGVLDLDEECLSVGWAAGRWVACPGFGVADLWQSPGFAVAAATGAGRKRFEWCELVRDGGGRRLQAKENGRSLSFPRTEIPAWMWDGEWNMVRLTVRGVDAADGRLWAKVSVLGTVIRIR